MHTAQTEVLTKLTLEWKAQNLKFSAKSNKHQTRTTTIIQQYLQFFCAWKQYHQSFYTLLLKRSREKRGCFTERALWAFEAEAGFKHRCWHLLSACNAAMQILARPSQWRGRGATATPARSDGCSWSNTIPPALSLPSHQTFGIHGMKHKAQWQPLLTTVPEAKAKKGQGCAEEAP